MHWGIVPLRIVLGIIFVVHGGEKIFRMGHAGVTAYFARLGIPAAPAAAGVVMAVEFLGGLALILGLFTRIAAALLAIEMLVAILVVGIHHGFPGVELPLSLLAGAVTLVLIGAGQASIDRLMHRR